MFFTTHVTIEADHRRATLIAEAASYRLAKQARAGRRRQPRGAPVAPPPDRLRPDRPQAARPAADRGARNSDADCRYAVPR